jgi:hypothetical protein
VAISPLTVVEEVTTNHQQQQQQQQQQKSEKLSSLDNAMMFIFTATALAYVSVRNTYLILLCYCGWPSHCCPTIKRMMETMFLRFSVFGVFRDVWNPTNQLDEAARSTLYTNKTTNGTIWTFQQNRAYNIAKGFSPMC